MAKSTNKNDKTIDKAQSVTEVTISDKAKVIPAVEEKPDQKVLDAPKPKEGVSLMKSWKHANSKK